MYTEWTLREKAEGAEGSGGGGGAPPSDPPKGDPPKGDPPPADAIPRSALPAELRDRPEHEVRFVLNNLTGAVTQGNKRVENLQRELDQLRGRMDATPAPKSEPDPDSNKPLEELIIEDTGKALDKYFSTKGYDKAFSSLASRVDSAEYESTVSKLPDYEEYREDVEGILNQANLPKTRNHVIATYKMVVGERALAGEYKPRRTGPLPPSNPPTDPPKTDSTPKLTSLEQEIATAHGLTPEEWVANRDADDLALKLPGIDR